MSAYRARVTHAHNLPSLEAPTKGLTTERLTASHTKANVVALVSPIQWHHDPTNFMFKFNYHQV